MNNLVNQQPGQLPAMPTDPAELAKYWSQMATETASTERAVGNSISTRNNTLSIADQPIPGNQFAAVILDAARLNTFYAGAYNPAPTDPPTCFAPGTNDADLRPHIDMEKDPFFKPQADMCSACPKNQFGSAAQGGGKACTNRRRLVMLLAGTYNPTPAGLVMQPFMDVEHYRTTAVMNLHLAPTSLKGFGEFVRSSAATYNRPFFGLVTRVYLYPHPTHGKEAVGFEALGQIPDDWASTIMARKLEAQDELWQGWEPPRNTHPGGGFHQQQAQHQEQQSQQYIQPPQQFGQPS